MIDRTEMLLVMAIIMEWAYQTYTVPDNLVKKHTEWCRSYSIMNMFMNEKKNVKLIHPDYLTKLDPQSKKQVLSMAVWTSPRFSNRESCVMQDKFHKMKPGDHSEQQLKAAEVEKASRPRTPEEELIVIEDDNPDFWKFTAKNDQEISQQLKLLREMRPTRKQATLLSTDAHHGGASKNVGKSSAGSIALI
ncbi:hypothetical protein ANCCAN_09798 [Ancylostoma caninum]|uniref:Uncharacterized protein n=1 Tax=Ancylostoma caninum TaxID=29170 RepID=A0A368GMK5_ANCCA|nr:hypothetical protein ANCCAN_09798 [Ancylostoma caninum]